jgi:hypothetical protein
MEGILSRSGYRTPALDDPIDEFTLLVWRRVGLDLPNVIQGELADSKDLNGWGSLSHFSSFCRLLNLKGVFCGDYSKFLPVAGSS